MNGGAPPPGAGGRPALRPALASWLRAGWAAANLAPLPTRPLPPCTAELTQQAIHAGLGGVLLAALPLADQVVAGSLQTALQEAYAATLARNLLLLADAGRLARLLGRWGIPVLFLKGAALLETIYPDPGWRAMFDVDLLVRPADADRTRAAACSLGYVHAAPCRAPSRQRWTKQELRRQVGESMLRLEIHTAPDGLGHRGGPAEDWLARGRRAQVGGEPTLVPDLEDLALHLAVHWTTERFTSRLKDSVDLFGLVGRGVDPAAVGARARQVRSGPAWDAIRRQAEQDGLLAPGWAGPDRIAPDTDQSRPPASFLRNLLKNEGKLTNIAALLTRVAGRRLGDRWASWFEGEGFEVRS